MVSLDARVNVDPHIGGTRSAADLYLRFLQVIDQVPVSCAEKLIDQPELLIGQDLRAEVEPDGAEELLMVHLLVDAIALADLAKSDQRALVRTRDTVQRGGIAAEELSRRLERRLRQ